MKNKIIIDTDIGEDPDDLFALLLAWKLPNFDVDLIVTADEVEGKRAIFAKTILDSIGWAKPKVVQGASLGKGIGGFTNLANYLKRYPEDKGKLKMYMMGGAINYSRGEGWVEHNVRIDKESTKYIIESGCDISLVMAQTTFIDEYEVSNTHPIFQKLKSSNTEAYRMLARHCELFNEHFKSKYGREIWPKMHDPLTVVSAVGKDFVTFHKSPISINRDGKMSVSNTGQDIYWSDPVSKHEDFMVLLEKSLFNDPK